MRRRIMGFVFLLAVTRALHAQQPAPGEYVLTGAVDGDPYTRLEGKITIVSGENGVGASIRFTREIAEFRGGGSVHVSNGTFTVAAVGTAYNQGSAAGECRMRLVGHVVDGELKGRWESVAGCARLTGKGAFSAERKSE